MHHVITSTRAGRRTGPRASKLPAALLATLLVSGGCAPGSTSDAAPAPLRAVLISDLNAAYGSTHYPAEVGLAISHITDTWRPDLVLVAGDMVAGQAPQLSDSAFRAMWQAFDSVVAAPLRAARIPLIVTPGNHDASAYPAHERDRRITTEYWRHALNDRDLPWLLDRTHYPMRYTLKHGDVFIIAWDATRQESATDDELTDWLRQSLMSDDAVSARHRVVLGHLPLYAVAEGRDRVGEVLAGGDALRRRLEDWGATLFISGHHHAYFPGRRGTLDLLHAGALGAGPRPLLGSDVPAPKSVSLIEFLADSAAITTYIIDAGAPVPLLLPIETLPSVICSSIAWVGRRDLAAVDTTCAR